MEIWGGIGRGMRGSSCVYVRGVWRFSFPCNLSLSSPNPLIGPITSPAMVVWFSPKVSMLCMYKLPLLLPTPVVQRVTVSLATMNRVNGRAARERQARHEGTRAGPSSERTVGRPRLHTLTTGRTPVPLSTSYHYLPAPRSSFVGREREMGEVKQALAATRLLTLTGTGGRERHASPWRWQETSLKPTRTGYGWCSSLPALRGNLCPRWWLRLLG